LSYRYGWWLGSSLGLCFLLLVSCQNQQAADSGKPELPPEVKALGQTIGDIARVQISQAIPLEGYGLVAGLPGTGSERCPASVRGYLQRFVHAEVPDKRISIDQLIASRNTAVVYLEGSLPRLALRGDRFDVKLTEVSRDATVSLAGGWVYAAEMWPRNTGRPATRTVARVKGASPIFYDRLNPDPQKAGIAYVLGGGYAVLPSRSLLTLNKSDYLAASSIRDLANGRFQANTAVALSGENLELTLPARYRLQRDRFYDVLQALYLEQNQDLLNQRLQILIESLVQSENKEGIELLLEGLDGPAVRRLVELLHEQDDRVRLSAGRALLNLGNADGLSALVELARVPGPQQVSAIRAIIGVGGNTDIAPILQALLKQVDLDVAQMIFEEAAQVLDGRWFGEDRYGLKIAGVLTIHQIADTTCRLIAVSRRMGPRIGLFDGNLSCKPETRLASLDGNITIEVSKGPYARVTRRLPGRAGVIGPLTCSRKMVDVIQALCRRPDAPEPRQRGCGLSYADLLPILKQMCQEGMVDATFRIGPTSSLVQ
jgi:hypothetical protein